MYEAEDYHEDFYILNNISFGLVSDLNDIINTYIVLHYHKWSNECPKKHVLQIQKGKLMIVTQKK